MTRPDWFDDAACRGHDPNLWFPEKGKSAARAKRICATCPVTDPCIDYALEHSQRVGIYGGMAHDDRLAYRGRDSRHNRADRAVSVSPRSAGVPSSDGVPPHRPTLRTAGSLPAVANLDGGSSGCPPAPLPVVEEPRQNGAA